VHKGGKLDVLWYAKSRQPFNARCRLWRTPILEWTLGTCLLFKYQNRRPDYIEAFFNVIDWTEVARRFALENNFTIHYFYTIKR
jgi:Fe-Mn family superoxide dismutase